MVRAGACGADADRADALNPGTLEDDAESSSDGSAR